MIGNIPWRPWERFIRSKDDLPVTTGGSGGQGNIEHVPWNPAERGFPPGTFIQNETPISDEEVARIKADLKKALQTRAPEVIPAFAPRHVYGGKGTIHQSSTIDVVMDENGEVKQVWFRCLELPFRVDKRDHDPGHYNPADHGYERRIGIEEITYVDLPGDEEE